MKIVIDKAGSRGYANHGWLKTYHTFSFADYYNPERVHFGVLRVLNNDTVAPLKGFGMHQHKNMEVISIPLKGFLRHGDSIQNSEVITPGDIQVMSAGTGIFHSEYNDSKEDILEFLQIWVIPREEDTPPHYQNYDIRPLLEPDQWSLFLSPNGETPATIQQNAWFSLGKLRQGLSLPYQLKGENTGVYAFIIEGKVQIGNSILNRRDGAGFTEMDHLPVTALADSYLLLMEVAMS